MADRGSIKATAHGSTDVGRVREHNEDNLLVADLSTGKHGGHATTVSGEMGERGLLLAVADGMGGAASGEIASATAVKSLYDMFGSREIRENANPEEITRNLDASLRRANEVIYTRGQTESEHRGMGTTMTAAFVLADRAYLAQVGDSRAYLLRRGKLVQVTKDQSLISQLIEDGTLTEEEAEKLGGRNIILQALGVEADVKVASKTVELLEGDLLLLCSDGLSGMVHDPEIEQVLLAEEDLEKAAGVLIDKANAAGGRDNITVVLARFTGRGLRPPLKPLEGEARAGAEAGTSGYVAPEVPEEKRSKVVPIILGAAALGVIGLALLLFLGGSGDVTFVFPAPNGEVVLRPEGGGEPIAVAAGPALSVTKDVPTGSYLLDAKIPNHEPLTGLPLKVTRGDSRIVVPIIPLPGRLALTSNSPWVRVVIRTEEGQPRPWRQEETFAAAGTRTVEGVPAGKIVLDVEREGFASASLPVQVAPGDLLAVTLSDLREIRGSISVECGVPDAEVTVVDSRGQTVGDGRTGPDGKVTLSVRTGSSHAVEVKFANHRPGRATGIKVSPDEAAIVTVRLVPLYGAIRVFGPAGSSVKLLSGEETRGFREIRDETGAEYDDLEPGSYRVVLTAADGRTEEKGVEVKPAETMEVRF
jgi:serine/threonine protein phosphatase PrpC